MKELTISQLAERAGVTPQTLRYYELRRLLEEPPRTKSGYRRFREDTVPRLRFIRRAQELGFSLEEIRELLSLRATPGAQCEDVRRRTEGKIAEIEEKMRTLEAMRRSLRELVAQCSGERPVTECPILEALDKQGWS